MSSATDSQFSALADATLLHCFDVLEAAYSDGLLEDLEHEGELVTLTTENGQTLIISKHNANKELWLASPRSGGSHFAWDEAAQDWRTRDGQSLYTQITEDLRAFGIEVAL